MDMRIVTTQFTLKFKNKIPCKNPEKFASDLIYYFQFFDVISPELMTDTIENIKEKTEKLDQEFQEKKKEYSRILGKGAKIRFTANELYSNNRVVALTTGLLRQKIMDLHATGENLPFPYEETVEFVENFIYRYLTKKQDKRLVDQVVFEDQ